MTNQELTPSEKKEVAGHEQVRQGRYFVPDVDIVEDDHALRVFADLPGVDPSKISVELHDDTLTLQGEVDLKAYEGLSPVYSEYKVGHYVRRFSLTRSGDFDRDKISARMVDGVLEVEVPKAERVKPRKIAIAVQ